MKSKYRKQKQFQILKGFSFLDFERVKAGFFESLSFCCAISQQSPDHSTYCTVPNHSKTTQKIKKQTNVILLVRNFKFYAWGKNKKPIQNGPHD